MNEVMNVSLDTIAAGRLITVLLPVAADQYYEGMLLKYNSGNSNYDYARTITTSEVVCLETKKLEAAGRALCAVAGSDIKESKIVDNANKTLAITEAARRALRQNGIILRS